MARKNMPKFEDWEAEKIKDPDFLAAAGAEQTDHLITGRQSRRGCFTTRRADGPQAIDPYRQPGARL